METECVLSLGEQQWTLPPGTDTITIGRASNADIRLQADDQISRIHARLNRDGGTWTLHDESRNGTGLNGRRITAPTPLTTGDRIHIGRSVLTFHKSATPTPHPAEPHTGSSQPPTPPAPAPTPAPPASAPAPAPPASAPPASAPPATSPAASALDDAPPGAPSPAGTAFGDASAAPGAETPRPVDPFGTEPPASDEYGVPAPTTRNDADPFAPTDRSRADETPSKQPKQVPGADPYAPTSQSPADGAPFAAGGVQGDAGAAGPAGAYGAAGVVPGFEGEDGAARSGDGGTWAAYPSADNPEPVRSPWEISGQIDQSEPNWNESDSWPDPTRAAVDRSRRAPNADQELPGIDRLPGSDQSPPGVGRRLPSAEQRSSGADRSTAEFGDDDAVGTVRLARALIAAGGILVLGLLVNLVVTSLADGPGGALRWLVPPGIALVVAMVLALVDAAAPKYHRPGRLDVSVFVAIAVVLVGVGVGGFALTAGAEYVGGYLTGNESGEDRLIKPVAKSGSGITMTVENVTYTSHFTRVEVVLVNSAKQAITIPIDGTTFTAADGTALRADTGRSAWPSRIASGGTVHGTITFAGHLPDSATTAVLTFKSSSTTFAVSGVTLAN